ncbi:TBC-domain-containing protein [Phellopilus nigrolimitatus]|nr:TBC-domain-containing protein [Phellopilus nigrolimitatus]
MTSTPSTPFATSFADTHPLSPNLQPVGGRRGRFKQTLADAEDAQPGTNYFTLKAQAEQGNAFLSEWSSSKRDKKAAGKTEGCGGAAGTDAGVSSDRPLAYLWETRPRSKPSVVINAAREDSDTHSSLTQDSSAGRSLAVQETGEFGPVTASQVLATKWHELSDMQIEATVSKYSTSRSSSKVSTQSYQSVLRVLSAALEDISIERNELDKVRSLLEDRDKTLRGKAERAVNNLPYSDREVGRRIFDSLFSEVEETRAIEIRPVTKRTSFLSLAQSLNEALSEDVHMKPSSAEEAEDAIRTPDGRTDNDVPDPMLQSDLSEGSSAPKENTLSRTDSFVSGSLPSSISSAPPDSNTASTERPAISKWMGTWWAKDKSKRERPPLLIGTQAVDEEGSKDLRSLASSPVVDSPTLIRVPSRTEKPARRKPSKSVFGSLGFSIMNPAISSSAKAPSSVGEIAVADPQPQEIENAGSIHSVLTSPVHDIPPATPIPPQLTKSIEPSDAETASSLALSSIKETDPQQGAALQAIVNATRVMTKDPASILADQGHETGELVARLAMSLVANAREEGIIFRGKAREKRQLKSDLPGAVEGSLPKGLFDSPVHADVKTSLSRTLSAQPTVSRGRRRQSASPLFGGPLFGPFIAEQQRKISNAVEVVQKSAGIVPPKQVGGSSQQPSGDPQPSLQSSSQKPRSVPLDSIIPETAKPPTQYLSKRYVSLTSKDFKTSVQISTTSSRYSRRHDDPGSEPLTDRYGFIYDVSQYDALLLRRAEECLNAAPACLTGVKIADRCEEDEWSDEVETDQNVLEVVRGECGCEGTFDTSSNGRAQSMDKESVRSASSQARIDESKSPSLRRRPSTVSSRRRSGTVMNPIASKSLMSILSVDSDVPNHVCEKRIRFMLHNLTEIHDEQQDTRRKSWDAFIKQRSKARNKNLPTVTSSSNNAGGAAAILGLGTSVDEEELVHSDGLIGFSGMGYSLSREERRDLERLIRGGVPLLYRAKIWLECSGALEMIEPGVFKDLLNGRQEEDGVVGEIEKDVGRTMPLNVFFGGDGPGIEKLRRVLIAYSRRNPSVGYCQGMNLVASTLLLVFGNEEEAFWVLCAIIEHILPGDFFSPSLLVSRACPLVLMDYVREYFPKLHAHLMTLEIDLPAICFSWFLSLFTDCLPVETLFRVWDLFFVDGLDVLFRIALSILKANEAELLGCQSISSVYISLESLPTRMWQADKLLQAEADLRSTLDHSDIVRRRNAHVKALAEML